MIVTSREDLNDKLWIDYLNYKDQSFIYGYTRKKKDGWAEVIARTRESVEEYEKTAKKDKYTLLRSAYLAYCAGKIPEEDYLRIFRDVVRVGIKLTKEQREEKKKTGRAVPTKAAEKYSQLSGKEAIDAAQRQWEKSLLKGTVSDFFYNLVYKAPKDGITAGKKGERVGKKHNPKEQETIGKMQHVYGDYFDLLFQFQVYSSQKAARDEKYDSQRGTWDEKYSFREAPGDETQDASVSALEHLDDAYIQKCEELFRQMNHERMTDVIVPLLCDYRSGAGVYLIGIEEIEDQQILMDDLVNPQSCVPCVIYYSDVSSVDMDQMTFDMTVESFNTVKEAFDYYRAKVFSGFFFENFAMGNEDRGYEEAPEGADPDFLPFFQTVRNRRKEIILREAQAEKKARERRDRIYGMRMQRERG